MFLIWKAGCPILKIFKIAQLGEITFCLSENLEKEDCHPTWHFVMKLT